MGLKVGDKVRVLDDSYVSKHMKGITIGSIATFVFDDGSDCPKFKSEHGAEWYEYLDGLEKITNPPTTVTGPATVTVAAGEAITFEGNATVKQDWVPKFGDRVVFVNPPEDMVGEFGVVTEIDDDDMPYRVAYIDEQSGKRQSSDSYWYALSEIKPYEAE